MPGSGEARNGDDTHPSTFTEQPRPTRSAQLSGEGYGEGLDHGYKTPVRRDTPDQHDHGPDN